MLKFLKNEKIVLIIILVLALFLRLYQVNNLPLYGDELTIALDSYSILKTAHSSTGQFLPLTFEMGAGRPAGYVYGSVPFIALFGPTQLGVRALSIISGLGIILLIYLLGKQFMSKGVGLVAALLMSISPWSLSLSRGGFEAHFALFLALLGTYSFLLADRKKWLLLISALSFGLTIHTYPTYKLVLPLFLLLLIWYKGTKIFKEVGFLKTGFAAAFLIIAIILAGFQALASGSEDRFASINLFAREDLKQQMIQQINLDRNLTNLPPILIPLMHNRLLFYGSLLVDSYFQNFSPEFLFLSGDRNPRHNMAGVGSLYVVEIITLVFGLIYLWSREKRIGLLLTVWLLIAPLATTLLVQTHALRSAFMLPPLIFISATGFMFLWSKRKAGQVAITLIVLVLVWEFIFVFENLYFFLPNRYSHFWADSAKTATKIAIEEKTNYDFIILSDRIDSIEYAYPVYTKADPNLVIEQNQKKENLRGYSFRKFENVYIGSILRSEVDNLVASLGKKVLFIGPAMENGSLSNFETIKGKDNFDALVVKRYL